jgi:ketosteroid isomerase-like protein
MSEENVDLVRRGWEAYERGDLSAALADMSPDLVTYIAPPIPVAGTYHGPEGLLQALEAPVGVGLVLGWRAPSRETG